MLKASSSRSFSTPESRGPILFQNAPGNEAGACDTTPGQVPQLSWALDSGTSWYLDLIRGLAAVGVLVSHAGIGFFSEGIGWIPSIGHEMVIVFFVLSGFVMSHAVKKVGNDWRGYATARFSRIVSVAYPALVLTIVCDAIGRLAGPELYGSVARTDHYWARMALAALFLQQSGPLSANPGSNAPFWSLAYEVWYYVLFGIWTFVRRPQWRFLALAGAGLVAGPKILLLLPVWLGGVAAHRAAMRLQLPRYGAYALFGVSLIVGAGLISGRLAPLSGHPFLQIGPPLYFSGGWWNDYQLGGVVAIHFFAASQVFRWADSRCFKGFFDKVVRFIADRSFSLYAFHMPLLYLISVTLPYQKSSLLQVVLAILPAIVLVGVLYQFTESRRDVWRMLAWSVLKRPVQPSI